MKKITVLGASGFTGRQACEKLLELCASKNDLRVVVAGRDRRELERISLELGKRYKQPVDIQVLDFADRNSLRTMCDTAAVIINCVAPYALSGPPLLANCVHAKVHLIDASNEIGHVEQCAMRAGAVKEAGIAVVNGLAVDPGVADLAAGVAAKGWEAVNAAYVLYAYRDLEETLGMRASLMESLKQPCRSYVERSLATVKIAGQKREFKWTGGAMKGKIMPGGEVFLMPRHLSGVRNVSAYRTLEGKNGMFIGMLGGPLASVGRMMLAKWAREGTRPSSDGSQFAVIVELEGMKNRRFAVVNGRGIYTTTAALLAHGAVRLATEGPREKGVISPAQAFDAKWLTTAAGLDVQVADDALVG